METRDAVVEIESLEEGLLPSQSKENVDFLENGEDSTVIYSASFQEMEENFIKYQTAVWVLYSLLFLLAWGAGVLMLLYLPVRRFILRKDFRSRKLCVTRDAIVYKVTRPVAFPCFGVLKKEKYVLLPTVKDIVIEQGYFHTPIIKSYLQSFFGVYSVRFENAGVRRPSSDDLQIQGITDPTTFRKAVLIHISNMKTEAFSRQVSVLERAQTSMGVHPQISGDAIPPGDLGLLQKLEEVQTSIMRVQNLIKKQQSNVQSVD